MPASQLLEIIDQLAKSTDHKDWKHPALREYLMHGDETLLEKVPDFEGQWSWFQKVAAVLPPPEQWTEESARLFQIVKLKGGWLVVKEWLGRMANGGNLETSFACVRAAGFSAEALRYIASLLQTWDWEGRKPTPFGLLLLDGADAEALKWLTPPGLLGTIKRQCEVLNVLATCLPERLHRLLDQHDPDQAHDWNAAFADRGYETMLKANPSAFADRTYRYAESLPLEETGHIRLMTVVAEVSPSSYLAKTLEEACHLVETAGDRGHPANVFGEAGLIAIRFLILHEHPRALELCRLWMNSVTKDPGGWRTASRKELWEELQTQHPEWQPSLIHSAVTSKCAKLIVAGIEWWKACWKAEDEAVRTETMQTFAQEKKTDAGETKVVALAQITVLFWTLMPHKSKEVRQAAAHALASLGETLVRQKAQALLQHKNAEAREAAEDLIRLLSAPLDTEASPGAPRRAKLLLGRAIQNPKALAYAFLEDMYADDYFPARLVDKVTKMLLHLCEQIEQQKPAALDALYKLTHAATEKINALQEQFEDDGSEIETVAREIISDNFCFIASIYGFENADREELVATRDW